MCQNGVERDVAESGKFREVKRDQKRCGGGATILGPTVALTTGNEKILGKLDKICKFFRQTLLSVSEYYL